MYAGIQRATKVRADVQNTQNWELMSICCFFSCQPSTYIWIGNTCSVMSSIVQVFGGESVVSKICLVISVMQIITSHSVRYFVALSACHLWP